MGDSERRAVHFFIYVCKAAFYLRNKFFCLIMCVRTLLFCIKTINYCGWNDKTQPRLCLILKVFTKELLFVLDKFLKRRSNEEEKKNVRSAFKYLN